MQDLPKASKKASLFILSAPGGTGKTTLANLLVNAFDDVEKNITLTTRKKRPGEVCGIDYIFIEKPAFEKKIASGELLEHSKVHENWYGVDKSRVFSALNQGKHVILVIDVQGAEKVKSQLEAVSIFISPPSIEALKMRLEGRGASPQELQERIDAAEKEMQMHTRYDYHIVNDHLEHALTKLKEIFTRHGASLKKD